MIISRGGKGEKEGWGGYCAGKKKRRAPSPRRRKRGGFGKKDEIFLNRGEGEKSRIGAEGEGHFCPKVGVFQNARTRARKKEGGGGRPRVKREKEKRQFG